MSNTTDSAPFESASPDFLFPLQKRMRNDAVTAQLAELARLSRSAVLRRAAETDPARRLARETLVALVRGYKRAGDTAAADAVLVHLTVRVSRAVAAKVLGWAGLTPEDKIDAQQQMMLIVCEQAVSLSPAAELWEGNFGHCLNMRFITLWRSLTDRQVPTVPAEIQMSGGEALDRLEQQPDPVDSLADLALRDLVQLVSGGSAKKSKAIFLKLSGFSEEEIAARLGVTSRTLRNWTAEARAAWLRHARQE